MPTSQERHEPSVFSDHQEQNEGCKRKRPQFYGFTDADISPTSALASTSSAKPKKGKTKKEKKSSAIENSVVALIQDAEQSRILSPPRPDIQIGQTSPPDSRTRYYEYEQEQELSVWDAENKIWYKLLKLCKLSLTTLFHSFHVITLRIQFSLCVC